MSWQLTDGGYSPGELREIAGNLDLAQEAHRQTRVNEITARRFLVTLREAEVLALLADGHTYSQCARLLVLSHSTIKTHAFNAYRKLHAVDAAHAVAIAFRLGILE
jgi:DNA-binding CsgD family transcriptional regulator